MEARRGCQIPWNQSSRLWLAAMWVLGLKLESSGRQALIPLQPLYVCSFMVGKVDFCSSLLLEASHMVGKCSITEPKSYGFIFVSS